jgi:hypothetical protein
MYTVVRFSASNACADEALIQVGTRLNELVPGKFERLDHIGRRFSVSVSKNDEWDANVAETLAFIQSTRSLIDEAQRIGIDISADALIEPEDFHGNFNLSCRITPEVQARFLEANVTLFVTIVSTQRL